jgi:hypothetical protein
MSLAANQSGTPSPGLRRLMKAPLRAALSPKGERVYLVCPCILNPEPHWLRAIADG